MNNRILFLFLIMAAGLLLVLLSIMGDRVVILTNPEHAEIVLHYDYRPDSLTQIVLGSRATRAASAKNWRLKHVEIRHQGKHVYAYPKRRDLFSHARPVLVSTPSGWAVSEAGDCEAYTIGITPIGNSYRIVVSDISDADGPSPMIIKCGGPV